VGVNLELQPDTQM